MGAVEELARGERRRGQLASDLSCAATCVASRRCLVQRGGQWDFVRDSNLILGLACALGAYSLERSCGGCCRGSEVGFARQAFLVNSEAS